MTGSTARWSVERSHCSAGGSHPLDDRWGATSDLAWVIDGATDITEGVLFPDAQGNASWLAERISTALAAGGTGSGRERLAAAIAAADAEATELRVHERVDFPTAVGVLAAPLSWNSDERRGSVEITVIGDCLAAVEVVRDGATTVELITDPAWAPSAPNAASSDPPWSSLAPDDLRERMRAGRRRRNTPAGRWIIRREPEAAEHAHVERVEGVTGRVVLFSDGAERALRRPGFTLAALVDAAYGDPDGFVADVHAWEDTEPAEIPRWWTRHDDVTIVALTLTS